MRGIIAEFRCGRGEVVAARDRILTTAVLHDRLDRRLGGLSIAFVEVEGRVELGLAAEQFLEARFVLER